MGWDKNKPKDNDFVKDGPGLIREIKELAVVGPASAINENLPVFDGVTGKAIKDSGKALTDIDDTLVLVLSGF